ncbi:MAG: hypothetical protein U5K27_14495 [Desulfotignum sp.]|nr:hypothetical protein [Desulfotignum sp.]
MTGSFWKPYRLSRKNCQDLTRQTIGTTPEAVDAFIDKEREERSDDCTSNPEAICSRQKTAPIDSNIIIYLTEKTKPFHEICQSLLSLVEEEECRAVISILTVAEVMHGPLRAGRGDIAMAVKNYLVDFEL